MRLHNAYKIKTDVALRNSELAVHSTQVQSLDPLESHRVFHVEICSSYEKMWSESLQMEREEMKMRKMKMRVHQQFPILCGAIRRSIEVRKGHETKYEKMHENVYENFDRFKKLC